MDWAEELKMSIRKKTARKGRRSKSRDLLDETSAKPTTGHTSSTTSSSMVASPKELSIDITLDMPQSSVNGNTSSTYTAHSTTSSTAYDTERQQQQRPPMLRRISGGWADTSALKGVKSKKNSLEDDLYQFPIVKSRGSTPLDDDIPVIPDIDDIKDDVMLNEIPEPSSVAEKRVSAFNELNSDLLSQNAFSNVQDADLSILTRFLQAQDTIDEPDEIWEWNKLFTSVMAEINTDKQKLALATSLSASSTGISAMATDAANAAAEDKGLHHRHLALGTTQ